MAPVATADLTHDMSHLPTSDNIKDEDAQSDSDADNDPSSTVTTTSDKRRARKSRFQSWLLDDQKKTFTKIKRELKSVQDEELSIRELLANQESDQIITDPREYQIELFERAKSRNIIAVLDTGSGKTLIAVLLLRHIIDAELQDRMLGKPPRIAFFLVPSVTLVFQQFAVIERNLDHKVDRFCGAMKCDLWSRETWEKHLASNHVIVCTADVLKHCLMHSFVTMQQINLLIFDEAHHAKKGHAYAQIIKDFYLPDKDVQSRPRIFGMTASPVDARVDVRQAARDLENILHCQIATASDLSLLRNTINRPAEFLLSYRAPMQNPPATTLFQALKREHGHIQLLKPMFDYASQINSELGSWCSDYYWSLSLAEKRAKKIETRVENAPNPSCLNESMEREIQQIKNAIDLVAKHGFDEPSPVEPDLSPKVIVLRDFLAKEFERPCEQRCIVFVEQRSTACLLEQLFKIIGGPNLHPGSLVGAGSGRIDEVQATFRSQVMTLIKFRKGELNCLFATSVAEEGLDVPDCNLVVRFDVCKTMIQYVQSRGRARHHNSKFMHMIQLGNWSHEDSMAENRGSEQVMRNFCEALPSDRMLVGDDMQSTQELSVGLEPYSIEATGAKITFGSALQIVSHFVASLPREGEEVLRPTYITSHVAGRFVCEVVLPEPSPVRSVVGEVKPRKSLAKCSAAFKACIELHKKAYLGDNLVPIFTKRLPQMRNAALALSSSKGDMYDMRTKPDIWAHEIGSLPSKIYLTLFDTSEALDRPHRPLLLVSRKPMPVFPEFPLFPNHGRKTLVKSTSFQTPCEITNNELGLLTSFTLGVFKDIFNKTYEHDLHKMPYWLAPAVSPTEYSVCEENPKNLIDWTTAEYVDKNTDIHWSPSMPDSFLLDKFLIDRWNGGRRFFSVRIAPEYKPMDPVPENTASAAWNNNILDYTVSLWKKTRVSKTWNLNQPVIEAEKMLHRRNVLSEPTSKEETSRTKSFLCPEPLRISALPTGIVSMCYLFPGIIHRIDSYLIARETCDFLDLDVDLALALEAITKDSDNTEDHENHERLNFQRGMGKNYERLEFLGDCFLKMATSISTFVQNPNENEFDYHVRRMLLLCNKNLFRAATKLKLHENIRSQEFSRRTWYPALKILEGKGKGKNENEMMKHRLGDKTIADVCEALMGAAFLTHDQHGQWKPEHWRDAVMAVTKLVDSDNHTMMEWEDYSRAYQKPAYQTGPARASCLDLAEKVEHKHAYHFRYPRLLQSAFHHPSFPYLWTDKIPSYQRLEFLGDSLLDLACVTHIFYRYPDKDPQWLTEHKMAMASNQFLGALCVKMGFHKHLLFNHDALRLQIEDYVEQMESAEATSQGAVDYWTAVKEAPKCLPDIVEAYVGAMFIDADFDYSEVQRFFDEHIKPFFEDMTIYDSFANNHPIIRLQNFLSVSFGCNEYDLAVSEENTGDGSPSEAIVGYMIHDHPEPVGCYRAKSVRYAKVKAAMVALEELKGLAPYEFRARYGCDCHLKKDGEADQSGGAQVS